jgi:putative membrane protein
MTMYYGGDAVDVAIMVLLCARWYRTSGRRIRADAGVPSAAVTSGSAR